MRDRLYIFKPGEVREYHEGPFEPATDADLRAAGWVPASQVEEDLHEAQRLGALGREQFVTGQRQTAIGDMVALVMKYRAAPPSEEPGGQADGR